jgi:hypothetical protein
MRDRKGMLTTAEKFDLVTVSGTVTDADTVRDLFLEYAETLGFNTWFAGFDQELTTLPGELAPQS